VWLLPTVDQHPKPLRLKWPVLFGKGPLVPKMRFVNHVAHANGVELPKSGARVIETLTQRSNVSRMVGVEPLKPKVFGQPIHVFRMRAFDERQPFIAAD